MDKTKEPEKDSHSVPNIQSLSSQITEKGITECSFSYNSFVKLHGKKIVSHSMTVLYPNPCYNEACYKGTAPWLCLCFVFMFNAPIKTIWSCYDGFMS